MILERYGIVLHRVEEQHLDMLRSWRNDDKIRRFMFYKGEITPAMQREWYLSANNDSNFFFIIEHNGTAVGLINISSIDWVNGTAYTGLFIYNDNCINTDVPVVASLAMLDTFFLLLGIQTVYAKVKGDNKVAHKYNTSLGFIRSKKIELGLGYEYLLTKETYLLKSSKLRNAAIHLHGNKTIIKFNTDSTENEVKRKIENCSAEVLRNLEVTII